MSLPAPMRRALDLAHEAAGKGEVPVGAVITHGTALIAEAHNQVERDGQAIHHAEILALSAASQKLGHKYLSQCTLWVTLEPCPMCAGAIAQAKVGALIFAASDPKSGGVLFGPQIFDQPTCHHRPEVSSGIGAGEAEALLSAFFTALR